MDRIRRIEIFLRAADAGSFAKAAASLALTPSAVSRAVADLERDLHVALFYRTTRQVRLTDDGEELYRRGHEILGGLADLQAAMLRTAGRVTGTLRVGLSVNINRYIIMPGLARFLRQHPGLRLEFSVISQPREMHAEGLDVMLRIIDPPDSALIARKMGELRFGVYASPEYLKTAGVPASPEDLLGHRCFVHRPAQLAKPLDEWTFERSGERKVLKITPAFSTTDREALIAAVIGGAGIMRIGMFDPALITSGRLRKLLIDWTCPGGQAVYAMYRKTPRLAPKIAAFLAFAEEAFAAFDPDELTIVHKPGMTKFARRRHHS
jgi:LysR family transcriptional regulator, transcriptional activator for dmlA